MDSSPLYSLYLLNNESFLYSFFISYKSQERNTVARNHSGAHNKLLSWCGVRQTPIKKTSWTVLTTSSSTSVIISQRHGFTQHFFHLGLKSALGKKALVHKFLSFQYAHNKSDKELSCLDEHSQCWAPFKKGAAPTGSRQLGQILGRIGPASHDGKDCNCWE